MSINLINTANLKVTPFGKIKIDNITYVDVNKLTMHIEHKLGERCEVDWAGTAIPIYDRTRTNVMGKSIFICWSATV